MKKMFGIEEEGPSESKGQPSLKRQKTEEEGEAEADTTEEAASVEKVVSCIDIDVDSEREKTIQRIVKSCKDCGASENVINHIISELRKPRVDSDSERADPVLWEQYCKQVEDTEGFGVTIDLGDDDDVTYRPVLNLKESKTHMRIATDLCNLAIDDYNKNNKEEGKEFKVVDIEWVVTRLACGILYLLTFKAAADDRDSDEEEGVKTFEAEVLYGGVGRNIVYLCRIKKETNKCIV